MHMVQVQVEEVVRSEYVDGQYFIMYFKTEGEAFKPEQVFGVDGAEEVAHIVSRFRATGLLLRPRLRRFPPRSRADREYDVIPDAEGVYVMQATDCLYKMTSVVAMSRREAEAYTSAQRIARENIAKFMQDPE